MGPPRDPEAVVNPRLQVFMVLQVLLCQTIAIVWFSLTVPVPISYAVMPMVVDPGVLFLSNPD